MLLLSYHSTHCCFLHLRFYAFFIVTLFQITAISIFQLVLSLHTNLHHDSSQTCISSLFLNQTSELMRASALTKVVRCRCLKRLDQERFVPQMSTSLSRISKPECEW